MILSAPRLAALREFAADVHVIGSGSVGIVTALALADRGFRVLVLESGGESPEPATEDLSVAECLTPDNHFEPHTAVARRLGGTSNLWAGRCVPFDPIDFRARPWLAPGLDAWPIAEDDLAPFLAPALAALGAGEAVFSTPVPGLGPGVAADRSFRCDTLERWTNQPRIHKLHAKALGARADLMVALRSTVTGFRYRPNGAIAGIELDLGEGGFGDGGGEEGRGALPASRVILAAGGNASTRLLLLEQERDPALFGGAGGPLGRFYMGHLSGQIADVIFESPALHDALDYHVDAHGSYVRRRLVPSDATQEAERLANVAFWPVVPPIANAAHRSGPLSAVFLALSLAPLGRRLIAEPVRLKHVGPPPYRRGTHLATCCATSPAPSASRPPSSGRTASRRCACPASS